MEHIHWYPGHIAKAERLLKEKINLVDVVIEILDARIPKSSSYNNIKKLVGEKPRLILLNKSDLADNDELKKWLSLIKKESSCDVLKFDAKNSKNTSEIINRVLQLAEPKIQSVMAKGLLRRSARVVVIGMPNVGKSSVINKLTKTSKTKIGAKAGVTRQQQWVRVNPKLDLLDTPGIIPMKQEDQLRAQKLAFVNSVSENAYETEMVAKELLNILKNKYIDNIKKYYDLKEEDLTLENIAIKRNWLIQGSNPDTKRTAAYLLKDFRGGKLGKLILDEE